MQPIRNLARGLITNRPRARFGRRGWFVVAGGYMLRSTPCLVGVWVGPFNSLSEGLWVIRD